MRSSSPALVLALLALGAARLAAQEPVALDARLSPDGQRVVARALDRGTVRALLVVAGDTASQPRWITPAGVQVDEVAWTPDGARVVYRAADGHLYVTTADASAAPDAPRDLTPDAVEPTRLAGFAEDGAALVELSDRVPDTPDLFRVPLAGGEPVLVERNEGGVVRWLVGARGAVLAELEGEGGERDLARIREGVLVPIYFCGEATVCEVAGFHPDGRVWVRSNRDRDVAALLLVDPLTLQVDVARADLGVDTAGVIREDSLYARDVARLRSIVGDVEIGFHGEPQADQSRVLVTTRGPEGAELHLFDRWAGTLTRVLPLSAADDLAEGPGVAALLDTALGWPEELRYLITDSEQGVPPTDVRRRIRRATESGRAVLIVTDQTEVPVAPVFELDTLLLQDPAFTPDLTFELDDLDTEDATDTTVLDAATLRPIRRRSTGPFSVELDFSEEAVRGEVVMGGFGTRVDVELAGAVWPEGAGLEMLVGALPLEEGYRTHIAWFDAGLQEVVRGTLTVTDAVRVRTPAGELDAWELTLVPESRDAAQSTWAVRREAPHVLLRATVRSRDYARTIELVEGVRP